MNNEDLKALHDKNVDHQKLAEACEHLRKADALLIDTDGAELLQLNILGALTESVQTTLEDMRLEAEKVLHPT